MKSFADDGQRANFSFASGSESARSVSTANPSRASSIDGAISSASVNLPEPYFACACARPATGARPRQAVDGQTRHAADGLGSFAVADIALFEAIYSARALRRLKSDPVPEHVLTKVLDAAIRAPSAGNAQSWSFVVVRDAEQRARLGAIYRKASDIASAMYASRGRPAHMTDEQFRRMMSTGSHLWDHMGDAPVL